MSDSPQRSRSPVFISLVILGVALVGGLVFFFFGGPPRERPVRPMRPEPDAAHGAAPNAGTEPADPGLRLSIDERRELLKLSHQAIGLLENERWREALKVLDQIYEKFPEDSFAARNAAVAISESVQMPNQGIEGGANPEIAETGIARLLKAAPNDAVSYILAGHITTKLGNTEQTTAHYQKAVDVDPQSAVAWYALFDTLRYSGVEGTRGDAGKLKDEQKSALKHVTDLLPSNLRAQIDMLTLMAETHDPAIAEQVEKLSPFIPLLSRGWEERHGKSNIAEQYREVLNAARKVSQATTDQEWAVAMAPLQRLKNSLVSLDPVQIDMARIKPKIDLEFMQFQFRSPAMLAAEVDAVEFHPAIPVKFVPAPEQITLVAPASDIRVADYDLDQRPDVWVLASGKLQIFGTAKDSPAWKLLAELPVAVGYTQFLAVDLDWDDLPVGGLKPEPVKDTNGANTEKAGNGTTVCHQADADLIVFGPAGIQIWKNQAAADGTGRTWQLIEKSGFEGQTAVTAVSAADLDHDGDLDLIVGAAGKLQIWSNRENFVFKDISSLSNLPEKCAVEQIIAVDLDRDVDLDLLIFGANAEQGATSTGVLINRLHGTLDWKTFAEIGLKEIPETSRRAVLLDADRNVSWDLAVLGEQQSSVVLTKTYAPGQISTLRVDVQTGLAGAGRAIDYDNDGILDLLSWSGDKFQLLRGGSGGKFAIQADVLTAGGDSPIHDCIAADIDLDGDLDLLVRTEKGVQVLRNDGGNKNHWLDVRLRARPIRDSTPQPGMAQKRVNHQGVGALVELQAGGHYLPQVVTGESTHFGLGQHTAADLVRVVWTNGVPQGRLDVKGDWEICEEQAPKGSCPFAYTWDGERFTFFTDLLWNAPLGLQFAEGVLAPARQWEYLKVPGERMVLKGDKYVLQITEELWEATYFDQIELLAIDHPADVEIYSNEKVGPPEIADYKIHTVRNPRAVVAARDQLGRNVLPEVGAEDGEFTRSYDRVLRQGLTTEHYLELDLGPFETAAKGSTTPGLKPTDAQAPAKSLTLFLTGWMYPTETSISVGVSQNPQNQQARPPALWIPGTDGEWREVRPFMGFPGGKTKTIAIDLTGVFTHPDHRLRIVTNMQFHWDHAFFSVDETPVAVKSSALRLESADLHYRGLSQHYWQAGNGPDQYDYGRVLPGPEWPPMQGMFTRYGDVRELLEKSDDLLAVIGAGDEMTLTFSPPEAPLPAGWKRDFILHNVGWDKDADLNTVAGQTVEPLPFNAMTGYPGAAQANPPDTAAYRAYLDKYQTRPQDYAKFWRRVKQSRPN